LALLGLVATSSIAGVVEVISGLNSPVRMVAPVNDSRLFVVERAGLVRIYDQQGVSISTFLDITSLTTTQGERGLVGLAFAPDYGSTGRFYASYTDLSGDLNIARYSVDNGDPNLADDLSLEILLTVTQPGQDHNSGHIEFGPDGML